MLPAVVNTIPHTHKRRHSRSSCLVWALVILLIGLSVGWFFVTRPLVHNIAQRELDAALYRAEKSIRPPSHFLPGIIIPIQEQTITELLVLNLSPSDPIKKPVAYITPNNVRIDFQLYGFPCAISIVPLVNNGHLVVRDANIEGIISLIMSPDEMITLLDKHLLRVQKLFQHSVTKVQLKDHEMNLTFR